jgi:hypothetical protein
MGSLVAESAEAIKIGRQLPTGAQPNNGMQRTRR